MRISVNRFHDQPDKACRTNRSRSGSIQTNAVECGHCQSGLSQARTSQPGRGRVRRWTALFLLLSVLAMSLLACDNSQSTGPSASGSQATSAGQTQASVTTAPSDTAQTGTTASQTQPSATTSTPATSAPTPTPTQAAVTDPAKLLIDVTTLPGFTAGVRQSDGSFTKSIANFGNFRWWRFAGSSTSPLADYKPTEPVAFGDPSTFTKVPGVLTFRGNNYRDAPAYGTADVSQKKLDVVWTKDIGAISGTGSYWPGAGWTGQPLLVKWPAETRAVLGIKDEFKKDENFIEAIYPVFEGKIYFLDLKTGKPTRDPINVGFGFKGTASVDPRGYPLLYAGQGLNDTNGTIGAFRYRIFDLIQNKEISGWPGKDPVALRSWGAFDSSALLNWQTDTLLEPGENGIYYKVKLNTKFDPQAKTVSLNPSFTKFRYKTPVTAKYGIESSQTIYRNLSYFSDNDGNLVCLDINTLQPVWAYNLGDDSDATTVLEETKDGVFLYHGNTFDKRGTTGAPKLCNLRKFNALTGQLLWQYDIPVVYESYLNAGLLATPLLGKNDLKDIVIFNVCKTTSHAAGTMVALDKQTGKPVWTRVMTAYSWSSPIPIRSKDGKTYGIVCDSAGVMHLFDPLTGKDISTVSIGLNCEASPSAFDDMIVVATYAKKIYGVKIS